MKIVLFKNLQRDRWTNNPAQSHYIGFASMKAYLNKYSPHHEVRYAVKYNQILPSKPNLIGVSSVSEAWPSTKEIITRLRKEGFSGPIILGGCHITSLPETLPDNVDCAVLGQGEKTFDVLVQAYEKHRHPDLSQVKGIAYREKEDLRRTPPRQALCLDDIPIDVKERPKLPMLMSTIRGCPFHCPHCVERPTQGLPRYLSAERLFEVMQARVGETGNKEFTFHDDTFLAAPGRLEKFHQILKENKCLRKFKIQAVSLNANLVKDHTIHLLREIGVATLGMGCESFNPRILGEIKYGTMTLDHIDKTIRLATREGMSIGGSQVHGYPTETEAEMVDSFRRVRSYEKTTNFKHWTIYVCQPLPGSKLWYRALKKGQVSLDMDFSRLRLEGNVGGFKSPWLYINEETVPRKDFLRILREHSMAPGGLR